MPLRNGADRLATALQNIPAGFAISSPVGDYFGERGAGIAMVAGRTAFDPTARAGGQATYSDRYLAFKRWAREYGLFIGGTHLIRPSITRGGLVLFTGARFYDQWIVSDQEHNVSYYSTPENIQSAEDEVVCPACGGSHPKIGTLICPDTGQLLTCPSCYIPNVPVSPQYDTEHWRADAEVMPAFACTHCGSQCRHAGCTTRIPRYWQRCNAHSNHATCGGCSTHLEWRDGDIVPGSHPTLVGLHICEECEMRFCGNCNTVQGNVEFSAYHNMRVCDRCRRDILRSSSESFDELTMPSLGVMLTIPGRERIRKVGVEIEGANGTQTGNELARDFYRRQWTTADVMTGHGSGNNYGLVHVERDSSVDWEAVVGPLNMADPNDAEILNGVMTTIREHVRRKTLGLDMRCGVHIHVGAERVSIGQAYNLSHLFTYLEDPLFRIAAAKWPFHRASQGSTYCAPIPKFGRKLEFFNNQGGNVGARRTDGPNHYYALSFQNYFNSKLRNCECGAVRSGLWDECTCPGLGKCTFEFRLFNTTANPRKMIAYLALSQALVAKAIDMPEIKLPIEEFPGMEFNRKVFAEMADDEKEVLVEAWRPRLSYIFNELPLTDEERAAILYCVKNSEIAAGLSDSEITELTTTRQIEEVAA